MFEKFILSMFNKEEKKSVLTIKNKKREIEQINLQPIRSEKKTEKKPHQFVTSLSKYFIGIDSLLYADRKFNLDMRKEGLQSHALYRW